MEPANICPYPRCEGVLAPGLLRCGVCRQKLLPCLACGSLNRSMATYCRQCGGTLTPQDEWRMPRANPEQTGYLPAPLQMPPVGSGTANARHRALRVAIDAPIVTAYDYLFVPTEHDGLQVVHVDTLGEVTALESPFGKPLLHAPVVAGGRVYLVSPAGLAVYDLTRTLTGGGRFRPELVHPPVAVNEHILTSPLVLGDAVVVATQAGLHRLENQTGTLQALTYGKSSLLARHGDCLVHCPDGETLVGVDLTGAVRWQRRPHRWQQAQVAIHPWAGLMSVGDRLVFADEDGRLWVLYPEGDQSAVIGHWPEGITGMAAAPDGSLVVASHAGLTALDSSGGRRWSIDHEAIDCRPVVTKHLVLAGTTGGSLLVVNRTTGAQLKYPVGRGAVRGIAVSGATVLAVTGEGDLAAYDLPVDGEA